MTDTAVFAPAPALPANMTTTEKVKDNAERSNRRLSIQAVVAIGLLEWAWETYAPPETMAYVDQHWSTLVSIGPLLVSAVVYVLSLVPQNIVTKAQLAAAEEQFLAVVQGMKDTGTLPAVLAVPAHVDKAKVDAVLAAPSPGPLAELAALKAVPAVVAPPGWSSIVMSAMQKVAAPAAEPDLAALQPGTATVVSNFGPASSHVDPFDDEPKNLDVFSQFRKRYPNLTEAEAATAYELPRKGTAP